MLIRYQWVEIWLSQISQNSNPLRFFWVKQFDTNQWQLILLCLIFENWCRAPICTHSSIRMCVTSLCVLVQSSSQNILQVFYWAHICWICSPFHQKDISFFQQTAHEQGSMRACVVLLWEIIKDGLPLMGVIEVWWLYQHRYAGKLPSITQIWLMLQCNGCPGHNAWVMLRSLLHHCYVIPFSNSSPYSLSHINKGKAKQTNKKSPSSKKTTLLHLPVVHLWYCWAHPWYIWHRWWVKTDLRKRCCRVNEDFWRHWRDDGRVE